MRKKSNSITDPCHRVLHGDDGIGGYRWGGVDTKRHLLSLEEKQAAANSEPLG